MGSQPFLRAFVALSSAALAVAVHAQSGAPSRLHNGVSRVMEIERVLGAATILREGGPVAMQPGFLLFSGDRMTLMPGSRVDLKLLRYGDIDAISGGTGGAHVVFEKLPFSSWAVDLSTHVRLDTGVLRVRWARSGDAKGWPLAVLVDRWKAELANGEYLFRRDDRGMVACSVSGKVDLVDDVAQVREPLDPGRCLTFTRQGTTERTELAIAEWPELGVVLLREQLGGPPPAERSLAIQPRPEPAAPIVPPPTEETASRPVPTPARPPPVPPRVPLSVAEESVQPSKAPAQPESKPHAKPQLRTEPAPPPSQAVAAPPPPVPPPADPVPSPQPAAAPAQPAAAFGQPAAAAAPTPDATAAESTPPSGPEWIVNVTTVTDPDVARQHVATLTSAGYPATLRKEVVRGRTSYRIVIGGISNEQGARRMAQLLSSKMGYTSAWHLQKR